MHNSNNYYMIYEISIPQFASPQAVCEVLLPVLCALMDAT